MICNDEEHSSVWVLCACVRACVCVSVCVCVKLFKFDLGDVFAQGNMTKLTSPSNGGGLLGLPIPSKFDAFLNKLVKDMLLKSKSKFIDDSGEDVMSLIHYNVVSTDFVIHKVPSAAVLKKKGEKWF